MISAKANKDARDTIVQWKNDGHTITYFTARTEELRSVTEGWLINNGFPCDLLLMGKPRGGNYHYIDDKQIRATRFDGKFGNFVKKDVEIEVFE